MNDTKMTTDQSVLNDIYQGAKVGSQAISDILDKIEDRKLCEDLRTQDGEYQTIRAQAAEQLLAQGQEPQDIGAMRKLGMKLSVDMNTLMCSDTSHIAEMMITGSTMGITNMTKILNAYRDPKPEIKGLGERLVQLEEQNIQRLKAYL